MTTGAFPQLREQIATIESTWDMGEEGDNAELAALRDLRDSVKLLIHDVRWDKLAVLMVLGSQMVSDWHGQRHNPEAGDALAGYLQEIINQIGKLTRPACTKCGETIHWASSNGRWFHDGGDDLQYDHRADGPNVIPQA
jgi:hypothetical protein